ncbi:bestrophin family ion channel [Gellertiella hungarica]|uniref:Putative membrane protein n=1 Tax=Gellertiella hungarica TaxID=1572859 RepID=A0A7W6J3M1_9HYPH|nr:putative membrane protein [Gellertiella hungarica]
MIIRPRPNLLQLFYIMRGSVVPRILPQIAGVAVFAAFLVTLHKAFPAEVPVYAGAPFALVGIALSIFLSFRNSACYDRWWEARKVWGEMVYTARQLARQTQVLDHAGGADAESRRRLLSLTIAFAQAMVIHLRSGGDGERVLKHLPEDVVPSYLASRNPPDALLRAISAELALLLRRGSISDILYQTLDRSVAGLGGVQAACERIRNTPVPFAYTLLLHRTAYLFCFTMPLGFIDALGWATPFASAMVAYAFFGLDALGDELEEPFGLLPNDLPIGALADVIEINLREAMGETDLPPLPVPVGYVLM